MKFSTGMCLTIVFIESLLERQPLQTESALLDSVCAKRQISSGEFKFLEGIIMDSDFTDFRKKSKKSEESAPKNTSEAGKERGENADGVHMVGEIAVKCTFGDIPLKKMLSDLIISDNF
jgi:hypothetical protein